MTPPKWPSISLPLTESSAPITFVSFSALIAVEPPLISGSKPRPDTLCCWLKPNLSLLTTLLLLPQGRRIFESAKQNP